MTSPGDLACLFALCVMALWFAVDSNVVPPPVEMDGVNYVAAAKDPRWFFCMPGIHAQRVLPPLLVWVGTKSLGLSVVDGFRGLSAASYMIFLCLLYGSLRHGGVRRLVALGTTVFCGISFWPMTYSLGNVYQACDAMAYPLGLLMVVFALKRKPGALFIASALGVLTRQQLAVLAVAAFIALYLDTRDRRALAYMAGVVALFAVAVAYLGRGDGAAGLAGHTVLELSHVKTALRAAVETKLPIMFTPFLLLFAFCWREAAQYAIKYWWVTLYAAATVVQPLFAMEMTGVSNAQRLGMMGVWPAFWVAGLLVEGRLKSRWGAWVYVALPLLYGTRHLTHLRHTYPSPVGHRTVMNVIVLALVLAEVWRGRDAEAREAGIASCPRTGTAP